MAPKVGRKQREIEEVETASTGSGTNSVASSTTSSEHRLQAQMKMEKRKRAEQRALEKQRAERAMARHMLNNSGARSKADRDEYLCNQLFTRIFGSASIIVGTFLFIIAGVILAQPCCGDHFSHDQEKWDKECNTQLDNETEGTEFETDDTENRSCYHRNVTGLIILTIMLIFMLCGVTTLCYGECAYDVNQEKDEEKIDRAAAQLKWMEMEQMEMARQEEAYERELRREEREYQRSLAATELSQSRRAHSIGSPSTPSNKHLGARSQVVQSHPYVYGNARSYNQHQQSQAYQVM